MQVQNISVLGKSLLKAVMALLFVTTSVTVHAQNSRFGEWMVNLSNPATLTEAYTANESGSTFGMVCVATNSRCFYYVSPQVQCEEGALSAALINADAGAMASQIKCTKLGDSYYSIVEETESLTNLLAGSKNIGIAFPIDGGKFKVVRFSLNGAQDAISAATRAMVKVDDGRDQIL